MSRGNRSQIFVALCRGREQDDMTGLRAGLRAGMAHFNETRLIYARSLFETSHN